MTLHNPLTEEDEYTKTVGRIRYILQTHLTVVVGMDPAEIYARLVAQHIHRYFDLKKTSHPYDQPLDNDHWNDLELNTQRTMEES